MLRLICLSVCAACFAVLLEGTGFAQANQISNWKPKSDSPATKIVLQIISLQQARKGGSDEWARKFQELIELGEAAVPDLCEELDAVPQEERYVLRVIPFALRGIGDKRAVPSLIRAFPKAFGRDGSDMGYRCSDPNLLAFMKKHDDDLNDSDRDESYSFGRPTREISTALQSLTQQNFGEDGLTFVSPQSKEPSLRSSLGQKQYHHVAELWADWWNKNSENLVDDPEYQNVMVPPLVDESQFPAPDRDAAWTLMKRERNGYVCTSMEAREGYEVTRCLIDIDTGRMSGLPKHLAGDDVSSRLGEILNWAAEEGFDLLGDQLGTGDEAVYVIRPVELKAWEVPLEWKKDPNQSFNALKATGREIEGMLVHTNQEGVEELEKTATILFETKEGTLGLLDLGVSVKNRWGPEMRGKPYRPNDTELDSTGMFLGRRFSLRISEP